MILSRQNVNTKVSNVTMYDYEQTFNTCTTIDSSTGASDLRNYGATIGSGSSSSGSSSKSKTSDIKYYNDGKSAGFYREGSCYH